ncbi:MAG: hypothetical protein WKF83_02520 [Nocardioidaceae bacterium]
MGHDTPPERRARVRSAGESANHAFDNDGFALHHPEASALAWQRTLDSSAGRYRLARARMPPQCAMLGT